MRIIFPLFYDNGRQNGMSSEPQQFPVGNEEALTPGEN